MHQDCYNKYYTINYYNDHIEIDINFIPRDNFNKAKIYFDLVVFYKIDNTIIKQNKTKKYFFKTTKYTSKYTQTQKY